MIETVCGVSIIAFVGFLLYALSLSGKTVKVKGTLQEVSAPELDDDDYVYMDAIIND
jgi:hypothetical protein